MWGCNENVSGGAGMTNAISVKDRLKKQAIEDGKTMQDKLVTYGLEKTIYRLSVSNYVERFTLKDGIFLYALFDGAYARATMDIDLLAQRIPNDAEEMKKVFNDIFSIECDDALRFDLNTLEVINITEFKEYHGVKCIRYGISGQNQGPGINRYWFWGYGVSRKSENEVSGSVGHGSSGDICLFDLFCHSRKI